MNLSKLLYNNELSPFLYDTLNIVIEFSENEPIYIPLFAKELYQYKHKGLFDKSKPVNYDKFLEDFRVLYCSCSIYEKRIETINTLSKLKPIGVFNYVFESYDWSPTIDHFCFYQLFKQQNNKYAPCWEEIRDEIDLFTKSNHSEDDDVKRQIRFSQLCTDKNFDKITFKNKINKNSLIVMKSTNKSIELNMELFADFAINPILLIGFEEEEFMHLKLQFKRISEGIYIHNDRNIISQIPMEWLK
jgi:hypothetical protein